MEKVEMTIGAYKKFNFLLDNARKYKYYCTEVPAPLACMLENHLMIELDKEKTFLLNARSIQTNVLVIISEELVSSFHDRVIYNGNDYDVIIIPDRLVTGSDSAWQDVGDIFRSFGGRTLIEKPEVKSTIAENYEAILPFIATFSLVYKLYASEDADLDTIRDLVIDALSVSATGEENFVTQKLEALKQKEDLRIVCEDIAQYTRDGSMPEYFRNALAMVELDKSTVSDLQYLYY